MAPFFYFKFKNALLERCLQNLTQSGMDMYHILQLRNCCITTHQYTDLLYNICCMSSGLRSWAMTRSISRAPYSLVKPFFNSH